MYVLVLFGEVLCIIYGGGIWVGWLTGGVFYIMMCGRLT